MLHCIGRRAETFTKRLLVPHPPTNEAVHIILNRPTRARPRGYTTKTVTAKAKKVAKVKKVKK